MNDLPATSPPLPTSHRFRNLTGRRFKRLTVVSFAGRHGRRLYWMCDCDCGTQGRRVSASDLTSGNTTSCGCWQRVVRSLTIATHRRSKSPIKKVWAHMRARCTRPSDPQYPDYGGRGITVCQGFGTLGDFFAVVGDPPPGLMLDRIDNDGGYWCGKCGECLAAGRPSNWRWATRAQQNRNRRNTIFVEYQGERLPLIDLAPRVGLPYHILRHRIVLAKWPMEKALSTPVARRTRPTTSPAPSPPT